MILDLNLPVKSGQEVLREMAADSGLNTIPVAVLTTSSADAGVCALYPPGRCRYFTKTDDFKSLREIVRDVAAHALAAPTA
jgi:DNA-binding response OmpR family regulator